MRAECRKAKTAGVGGSYLANQVPFGSGKNRILKRNRRKENLRLKPMDMAEDRGALLMKGEPAALSVNEIRDPPGSGVGSILAPVSRT